MIFSIYILGTAELRKTAEPITADYPELDKFIKSMWKTMYASDGVGLAAPQVGRNIRLAVVDATFVSRRNAKPAERSVQRAFCG